MDLKEIIAGCQEGSRAHQEALYRHFARKMYGVCMVYVKNREDASDILHDGFMKIFSNFKKFDPDRELEPWIRRIMVNAAIDHLRRISRFREIEWNESNETRQTSNPVFESMKLNDLKSMIDLLPVGARTIFNLYTVEGYNHREIAKMLEISEGTSKSQYSRARQLLQTMLGKGIGS